MSRRPTASRTADENAYHDDSVLMIPPPGYKFIPKSEFVCGKSGCFECYDIYCERCDSKDRRIVELEMRNNDLVKYITQLQGKLFGTRMSAGGTGGVTFASSPSGGGATIRNMNMITQSQKSTFTSPSTYASSSAPYSSISTAAEPFAYIQSPVLFDPSMNVSYVATTTFSPAPNDGETAGFEPATNDFAAHYLRNNKTNYSN